MKSNKQTLFLMAIVRIGKGSLCRLERSRAFEILKADSSYYKVVGTFDVAQRTLSKLMAIYREKCSVRSGRPKKDTVLSLVKKKPRYIHWRKILSYLVQQHGRMTIYLAGDMRFYKEVWMIYSLKVCRFNLECK